MNCGSDNGCCTWQDDLIVAKHFLNPGEVWCRMSFLFQTPVVDVHAGLPCAVCLSTVPAHDGRTAMCTSLPSFGTACDFLLKYGIIEPPSMGAFGFRDLCEQCLAHVQACDGLIMLFNKKIEQMRGVHRVALENLRSRRVSSSRGSSITSRSSNASPSPVRCDSTINHEKRPAPVRSRSPSGPEPGPSPSDKIEPEPSKKPRGRGGTRQRKGAPKAAPRRGRAAKKKAPEPPSAPTSPMNMVAQNVDMDDSSDEEILRCRDCEETFSTQKARLEHYLNEHVPKNGFSHDPRDKQHSERTLPVKKRGHFSSVAKHWPSPQNGD